MIINYKHLYSVCLVAWVGGKLSSKIILLIQFIIMQVQLFSLSDCSVCSCMGGG